MLLPSYVTDNLRILTSNKYMNRGNHERLAPSRRRKQYR
jgi:hypothetical protein